MYFLDWGEETWMNSILSEADIEYMQRVSEQREREMKSGSGQVQLKEGWEIPGGKREMDGHRGSLTECVGQGFPNSNISCGRETATVRLFCTNDICSICQLCERG